jgi:hypothetical protein
MSGIRQLAKPVHACSARVGAVDCGLEAGHNGPHFAPGIGATGMFWMSPTEAINMVDHLWDLMPEVSRKP